MLTPETLLRMDAKKAMYAMAQSVLDTHYPGLKAEWYRMTTPTVVEGTLTEVRFVLDKVKTPVEHWDVLVSFPVRYHRLPINDVIQNDIAVIGLSPTTTHYLLQDALSRYDIPLSKDELTIDNVSTPGTVDVVMNPEGYRWIGSAALLYDTARVDVGELIKRNAVVTNFSDEYASASIRDDIITHLNRVNAKRLPKLLNKGDVRFCSPIALGADADAFNTKIKLVATGRDYTGSDYIFYKRRHFQSTWRKPITLTYAGWTSHASLASELSRQLECLIAPSDIIADEITLPSASATLNILVRFKPESLAYVGWVRVIINDVPTEIDLANLRITSTGLIRRDADGEARRFVPEARGNNARVDYLGNLRKDTGGRIRRYLIEESFDSVRYATSNVPRRDTRGMLRKYKERPVIAHLRVTVDDTPRRDTYGRYRAFVIGDYSEDVRLTTFGEIRRDVWGNKRLSANYTYARRSSETTLRRLTDYSIRNFRRE